MSLNLSLQLNPKFGAVLDSRSVGSKDARPTGTSLGIGLLRYEEDHAGGPKWVYCTAKNPDVWADFVVGGDGISQGTADANYVRLDSTTQSIAGQKTFTGAVRIGGAGPSQSYLRVGSSALELRDSADTGFRPLHVDEVRIGSSDLRLRDGAGKYDFRAGVGLTPASIVCANVESNTLAFKVSGVSTDVQTYIDDAVANVETPEAVDLSAFDDVAFKAGSNTFSGLNSFTNTTSISTANLGTANVQNSLAVGGSATVGSTLGVTGATTLQSTLAVTGTLNVGGRVTVTADRSTFEGDLEVDALLTSNGGLQTNNNISFASFGQELLRAVKNGDRLKITGLSTNDLRDLECRTVFLNGTTAEDVMDSKDNTLRTELNARMDGKDNDLRSELNSRVVSSLNSLIGFAQNPPLVQLHSLDATGLFTLQGDNQRRTFGDGTSFLEVLFSDGLSIKTGGTDPVLSAPISGVYRVSFSVSLASDNCNGYLSLLVNNFRMTSHYFFADNNNNLTAHVQGLLDAPQGASILAELQKQNGGDMDVYAVSISIEYVRGRNDVFGVAQF